MIKKRMIKIWSCYDIGAGVQIVSINSNPRYASKHEDRLCSRQAVCLPHVYRERLIETGKRRLVCHYVLPTLLSAGLLNIPR